jgi:osmotically inducible protein OsmC
LGDKLKTDFFLPKTLQKMAKRVLLNYFKPNLLNKRLFTTNNNNKVLYTAESILTGGGREGGIINTNDGRLKLKMNKPKEMGGSTDSTGTNPEQLFAAGYSACFAGAMAAAAKQLSIPYNKDPTINCKVSLNKTGDKLGLAVEMNINFPKEISKSDAHKIIEKAHESICPYSHATRNNIPVKFNVV